MYVTFGFMYYLRETGMFDLKADGLLVFRFAENKSRVGGTCLLELPEVFHLGLGT